MSLAYVIGVGHFVVRKRGKREGGGREEKLLLLNRDYLVKERTFTEKKEEIWKVARDFC